MYESILTFLQREGYLPFVQVPHFSGRIDFVGIKDSECLVIEGKVSKWKNGLIQALKYGYGAEEAYVALPKSVAGNIANRHGKTFEKYGVGIVEVGESSNIVLSCEHKTASPIFKQMILNEIQKENVDGIIECRHSGSV